MKNILLSSKKLVLSNAFLLLCSAPAHADDKADLQALVEQYVAATLESSVDKLSSDYAALGLSDTYHDLIISGQAKSFAHAGNETFNTAPTPSSARPKITILTDRDKEEGTGGDIGDSTWSKGLKFDDASASKALSYAEDRCAGQPVSQTLTSLGISVDVEKFNGMRNKFCTLVKTAANLKKRYDHYQAIKDTGVMLAHKHKKETFKIGYKDNGIKLEVKRTVQMRFELKYFPDPKATFNNIKKKDPHLDQKFQYHSYFKWSDDDEKPLDIIKTIREQMEDGTDHCRGVPIPLNEHLVFYTKVMNATTSSVTIKNCVMIRFKGKAPALEFPEYTVKAPFGYLADLEAMKDEKKQELLNNMTKKIADMIGINEKIVSKIKAIQPEYNSNTTQPESNSNTIQPDSNSNTIQPDSTSIRKLLKELGKMKPFVGS